MTTRAASRSSWRRRGSSAQYESDYTIKFIAFSMEEVGLYGSYAYANAHSNDDIMFMISADMVAYDTGTDRARVYSRGGTLMNTMGAAIDEYGDGLTWIDAGWISASDHAPFDSEGFEAALLHRGRCLEQPVLPPAERQLRESQTT
jgi:Zn-dependent M28 family amino/carboxypeptidase